MRSSMKKLVDPQAEHTMSAAQQPPDHATTSRPFDYTTSQGSDDLQKSFSTKLEEVVQALRPQHPTAKWEEFVLQAFCNLVVHIVGLLVLVAFYYNWLVLDQYILALFWACICSIPMFQIKVWLTKTMFGTLDMWMSKKYSVLSVSSKGVLEMEEWPGCGDGKRPKDLKLPDPVTTWTGRVKVMAAKDIQDMLKRGKRVQAIVRRDGFTQHLTVTEVCRAPHWLGFLRPYESWVDFLTRDIGRLCRSLIVLITIGIIVPLQKFIADDAGSEPYFALLIRLCTLQFFHGIVTRAIIEVIGIAAAVIFVSVVCLRIVFNIIGYLTPKVTPLCGRLLSRIIPAEILAGLNDGLTWFCSLVGTFFRASRGGANSAGTSLLRRCINDSQHFLSLFILLAAIYVCIHGSTIFAYSLNREVQYVSDALYRAIQDSPLFQATTVGVVKLVQMAGVVNSTAEVGQNATSLSGLWMAGESLLESALPQYKEVFRKEGVPDMFILKYFLYDMWHGTAKPLETSHAFEAFSTYARSITPADAELCMDAWIAGATCEAAPSWTAGSGEPLQQQLNSTTSLLRLLAQGNFSAVTSLGREAYNELSSVVAMIGLGEQTKSKIIDGAMQSGTWIARLAGESAVFLHRLFSTASFWFGQTLVFLTALYYLINAERSCLEHVFELLTILDRSKDLYRISESVVRAVLLSALELSAFHALFTWLTFAWCGVPVIVMPTMLAAIAAMFPFISPVWLVSVWGPVYVWAQNNFAISLSLHNSFALFILMLNIGVWWQVPTVIYAEIPESNAWLTGLSVGVGLSHFGVSGVVLGPLIASVPLICANLLHKFADCSMLNVKVNEESKDESPTKGNTNRQRSDSTLLDVWRKVKHPSEDCSICHPMGQCHSTKQSISDDSTRLDSPRSSTGEVSHGLEQNAVLDGEIMPSKLSSSKQPDMRRRTQGRKTPHSSTSEDDSGDEVTRDSSFRSCNDTSDRVNTTTRRGSVASILSIVSEVSESFSRKSSIEEHSSPANGQTQSVAAS